MSKKREKNLKKCPFCKNDMRYKGPKKADGTVYWKCKKCGRTVEHRCSPKDVQPLIYK